jgi:Poly(ADP-ribose) polymerase and DNA-Ligase Zn-finger region
VPHVIESASSGRAKCRGCARQIQRGELRFGERLPNPFAEGEMMVWFHLICAAYKRPEQLLEILESNLENVPDRERLERIARSSLAQRRLPRIDGAERAPSGQAKCRCCREPIARGAWRIRLVFYEEGRFSPGGFVHLDCRTAYFEASDVLDRVLHFSPDLSESEREELRRATLAPS